MNFIESHNGIEIISKILFADRMNFTEHSSSGYADEVYHFENCFITHVKSSESPINNVKCCTAHLQQEIMSENMHNMHEKQ